MTIQGPMRESSWRRLLLVVIALGLVAPSAAHAYLDPATGSILIQTFVALVAGAAFFARMYWNRLKSLMGIKSPDSTGDDESVER